MPATPYRDALWRASLPERRAERCGGMPASIVQGLLELVFQAVFELAGYFVGKIVVRVVSRGRWQCDNPTATVPRKRLRGAGCYHVRNGQVYVTAEATSSIGVLTMLLIVGGVVAIWLLRK